MCLKQKNILIKKKNDDESGSRTERGGGRDYNAGHGLFLPFVRHWPRFGGAYSTHMGLELPNEGGGGGY